MRKTETPAKKAGNRKAGFTLVEILVVILIIGILFTLLVPKITSATDKAREAGVKTDFRSYQLAFEQVAREQGTIGGFGADKSAVITQVNYYLDTALQFDADGTTKDDGKKDPWGRDYTFEYKKDTDDHTMQVTSGGKRATTDDDYTLLVKYDKAEDSVYTATFGFSSNIKDTKLTESDKISA